jgi:hypothetical protein
MKIVELKKRNNMLDANLAQKELARVETKHKLEETVERLKITEEKNLESHIIISKIDRQGEELQNAICVERKTIEE